MSDSSSDRGPATAALFLHAAEASRKLTLLWRSSEHIKLLLRPPPDAAAASGEPLRTTQVLLSEVSSTLAMLQHAADTLQMKEQLLHQVLVQHQLPELLANLLEWLQKRPQLLHLANTHATTTAAAAAAAATEEAGTVTAHEPAPYAKLWLQCMACVANTALVIDVLTAEGSSHVVDFADCLTKALKDAGKPQLQQQLYADSTALSTCSCAALRLLTLCGLRLSLPAIQ
jgi:hypothetical protein